MAKRNKAGGTGYVNLLLFPEATQSIEGFIFYEEDGIFAEIDGHPIRVVWAAGVRAWISLAYAAAHHTPHISFGHINLWCADCKAFAWADQGKYGEDSQFHCNRQHQPTKESEEK